MNYAHGYNKYYEIVAHHCAEKYSMTEKSFTISFKWKIEAGRLG